MKLEVILLSLMSLMRDTESWIMPSSVSPNSDPSNPPSQLMQTTPCDSRGASAVQWVRVTPCNSDPCVFEPTKQVTITVSAIAPKDIDSANLQAYVPGMKQAFPGFSMDICDKTPCPILNGTEFLLTHTITVPVVMTRVVSDVNFITTTKDGDELLSCVTVHVILDDGKPHFLPPMDAVTALQKFEKARRMIDPFGFSDMFMPEPKAHFKSRDSW